MRPDCPNHLHQNMKRLEALYDSEIKVHAKETNGHITELKAEHYRQAGAIMMLRWLGGLTLAGIGAGGTIAGVVLAIVARGT